MSFEQKRYFESGLKEGAKRERERILALLETEWRSYDDEDSWANCICSEHYNSLITFIKGKTE